MREYTLEVVRRETVTVRIPDGMMTEDWLQEWPKTFYKVCPYEEETEKGHAQNLARMLIDNCFSSGQFFEGYGPCSIGGSSWGITGDSTGIDVWQHGDVEWEFDDP